MSTTRLASCRQVSQDASNHDRCPGGRLAGDGPRRRALWPPVSDVQLHLIAGCERLHQLRVHALERIAERALRRGRFGKAIDSCLAAIAADPLRESAHRLLINAYLAEGNSSAGLRQYHEYCRRANEELGLEPSAQ